MPRKFILFSALGALAMLIAIASPIQADIPTGPGDLKNYANQLSQAFPGEVDLYFATDKNFEYGHASLTGVRIVGCSAIAGTLYYVIRHDNGSDSFVPQSQVVLIHNHK